MPEYINEEEVVKIYDLTIGKVFFYENYLVIEVAEGMSFNHEKAKELSVLTNLHFENRPFGYISNRIHSYSLDPMDYTKIWEVFPNLKSFAIVAYNDLQKTSIRVEKMFFKGKINTFENLNDAIDWVKKELT